MRLTARRLGVRRVTLRSWRHWSIRSRMVLSVAAVAAIALIVSNAAAVTLLRSYLVNRIDEQLAVQARGLARVGVPFSDPADEHRRPPMFGPDSRVYQFDRSGELVSYWSSSDRDDPDLTQLGDLRQRATTGEIFTVDGTESSWRVMVVESPRGRGFSVSAVSLREVAATQDWFLLFDLVVGGLVLAAMGIIAASVVRLGLRPLTRMQDTAAAIAEGDLSRRVTDADPHTEAGQLGTALNAMLTQIEAAVAERAASERRLRQLLADAAHELRTPLTSIQGFAELYQRGGAPPGPDLDEAMTRVRSEASRMRLLVNDLLLLARLDEERTLERRPVDLLEVAADAIRDAHVRVPSRFVELAGFEEDSETFEPVTIVGDDPKIRQVVTNLVANALQHAPAPARVVVRIGRVDQAGAAPAGSALAPAAIGSGPPADLPVAAVIGSGPPADLPVAAIEVADTGPGMRQADAERVFERLYRADPSRSRKHGGAGLGLAIVASIVQAHGGRIELRTAPGQGARFRVLLAAQPPVGDDPGWPAGG